MPKSVWGHRNFWEYHSGRLDIVLYDARELYMKHIRQVHPRRMTDGEEAAKNLNMVWQEIQRRFHQHMQPQAFWATGKNPVDKDIPQKAPPGFFLRRCPFPKCGRVFFTKRKNQKYCHRLHMQSHGGMRRYYRLERPRMPRKLVKCRNPKCGRLFWSGVTSKRRFFCSGKCCGSYHQRLTYKRNPEKYRANRKAYYQRNREKCLASVKNYAAKKREREVLAKMLK